MVTNADESEWKTVESTYALNDRWLKVRTDTLLTPDGKTISPWYVLEYPEWVNCLVIDEDDNVILLSHYRHGINDRVTEIIGGVADVANTSPLESIERELHEEIGLEGGIVYKTGIVYANPSNQNNKVHMFVALGGAIRGEQEAELGADFKIIKMPFKEFYEMCTRPNDSDVFQGLHMASVFYALNFIKNTPDTSLQFLRLRAIF